MRLEPPSSVFLYTYMKSMVCCCWFEGACEKADRRWAAACMFYLLLGCSWCCSAVSAVDAAAVSAPPLPLWAPFLPCMMSPPSAPSVVAGTPLCARASGG